MIETEKKEGTGSAHWCRIAGNGQFDLSMEEFASLAKTAGAVVVDSYRQNVKV